MHPVACDQRTRARVAFALRLRGVLPRGDAHQATLELLEPAAVTTALALLHKKWLAVARSARSVARASSPTPDMFGGAPRSHQSALGGTDATWVGAPAVVVWRWWLQAL